MRPLHEKIVCHQARQKGAQTQRGSLHGVNDRLSTFLTQYGGKIALVQRSLIVLNKEPTMATKRKAPRKKPAKKNTKKFNLGRGLWQLTIALIVFGFAYTIYLDAQVRQLFEGHRWTIPAKVYARPLELFIGKQLASGQLAFELQQLGYRKVNQVRQAGQFVQTGNALELHTRSFHFTDQSETGQHAVVTLSNDASTVMSIRNKTNSPLHILRLEPQLIGGIYPAHNEDRALLKLTDLPKSFLKILLIIEDRDYYNHRGVSPMGVIRALYSNLVAGRVVQGGSTLTQQLVKNFYLTAEQTLWRKANEAVMAILLDSHYSKDEILEVYLNEVFLGQQGKRAIHGFELGSQYYFGQPIKELSIEQMALLVGLIKGPSFYNPKRFPERSRKRRNLVLWVLAEQGLLTQQQLTRLQEKPLGLSQVEQFSRYPAYMDIVRKQLQRTYANEDLSEHGLRIFTTLSPWAQHQAEQAVTQGHKDIKTRFGNHKNLQSALILSQRDNGEILAIVGDKDGGYAAHNWVLDESRQIGSLIKPVIHLTALESGRYHLLSPISDEAISIPVAGGDVWQPKNYDNEYHGTVPMYEALMYSYNLANIRLGLDIGVTSVLNKLSALSSTKQWPAYPSRLLGALELSPFKVNQVYQTIANNGFASPLSIVRNVTGATGNILSHYPFQIQQAATPKATYILQQELALVGQLGTAKGAYRYLPNTQLIAGKTGTTNDQKDSWFSGFSGRHVATVWVGNSDAAPTPLTGASGALPIWARLMAKLPYDNSPTHVPEGINFYNVDRNSGNVVPPQCAGITLPFEGTPPLNQKDCY